MKKRCGRLIAAISFLLSLLFPAPAFSVEYFMEGGTLNNGRKLKIFVCDNRQIVKITSLGKNRFRFHSVGGKGIMKRKTDLEVAEHVCRYYLKSK